MFALSTEHVGVRFMCAIYFYMAFGIGGSSQVEERGLNRKRFDKKSMKLRFGSKNMQLMGENAVHRWKRQRAPCIEY